MQLPGVSRKIIGMCYNVSGGGSSFSQTPQSLTLRVPFVPQGHVNLCTDATAAMIVQAWGYQTKETKLTNKRGAFKGAQVLDHTDIAVAGEVRWRSMSLPNQFSVGDLVKLLLDMGPLGAGLSTVLGGHAVVIIGAYANNNEVVVHDPWKGPFKMLKFDSFKQAIRDVAWIEKINNQKLSNANSAWKS